jgi:hypothetical protein
MNLRTTVATALLVLVSVATAQTTQQTNHELEFATFGIKCTAPAHWKRLPEDSSDMIARWTVPGPTPDADVTVIAELETSKRKVLKTYAADIAAKAGAQARPEVAGLGEDPTWKIIYPSNPAPGLQPRAALVAIHDEYLYRVTAHSASPTPDADAALEDLRRNWTALREEPIAYLDKLTVRPPAVLRPKSIPIEKQGKALEFQIFNYRSGRADMVMTMEADNRPPKKSLDDLGRQLLLQMNLKQDPQNPIKWKKLEGDREAVISDAFPGARAGTRTVPLRFALIALNEKEVVLLGFVFPTGDKTDQQIYEDLSESMAQTIAPLKK